MRTLGAISLIPEAVARVRAAPARDQRRGHMSTAAIAVMLMCVAISAMFLHRSGAHCRLGS